MKFSLLTERKHAYFNRVFSWEKFKNLVLNLHTELLTVTDSLKYDTFGLNFGLKAATHGRYTARVLIIFQTSAHITTH